MEVGDTHDPMIIVFEYGLLAPRTGSRDRDGRTPSGARPQDRDRRPAEANPPVRRPA